MSSVTMCTCTSCVRRVPLLPNLKLRRSAVMGIADFTCPWCGTFSSWAPGNAQWKLWKDGLDGWLSDLSAVLAAFEVAVALSGDRVCELLGGDQ